MEVGELVSLYGEVQVNKCKHVPGVPGPGVQVNKCKHVPGVPGPGVPVWVGECPGGCPQLYKFEQVHLWSHMKRPP